MSSQMKLRLSRLMRLSWDIQKDRKNTRSTALKAAWTILRYEDITLHYLVRRLNHHKPVPEKATAQMGLFHLA